MSKRAAGELAISADDFRSAMRMHSSAVSLVCTATGEQRWGIAATSVVGLTAEPAQMLVCINRSASVHGPIMERGAFSINVLARHHLGLARAFGGEVPALERFRHGTWSEGPGGMPLLCGALVAVEAELVQAVEAATHTILIGRLTEIRIEPGEPLIFYDRRYGDFQPAFPPRAEWLDVGGFY